MSIILDGTNGITFPAGGLANPAGNLISNGANVVIQSDGTLVMQTDGTTAVTIGSDQSVTMADSLTVSGNLTASGNISGSYILGNGSQLTGLPEGYTNANVAAYLPTYTGNLVGLTGNVTTTGTVSAGVLTGTLSTAAQPSVTSVGTLSSLNVTSNVNIGSTTNYGGLLSVNRAQTSSVADLLTLRDASAGTTFNLQTYGDPAFGTVNRFNYDGAYLAIRRSGTEQMRLDSAGRVTMPLQPTFSVWNIGGGTSLSGNIILNTVLLNNGNHYSTATGRFTAPIAGMYFFLFTGFTENSSSGSADISIFVNGIARVRTYTSEATGTYRPFAVHCMISLAAGDFVQPNSGIQLHSNQNPVFSGYLIG